VENRRSTAPATSGSPINIFIMAARGIVLTEVAAETSDPMLFKHRRNGDFFYDIPLRPGVYELHLYFVAADPLSIELSTFTVDINGDKVLLGFDVRSDALGANNADERVFRDVSPASNGILHLGFTSELSPATLNAIEILPGTPHRSFPSASLRSREPSPTTAASSGTPMTTSWMATPRRTVLKSREHPTPTCSQRSGMGTSPTPFRLTRAIATPCPDGEIGRRSGLKIRRPQGRGGSSPPLGTKPLGNFWLGGYSGMFPDLNCQS
jgi:hypothetical protein